MAWVPCLFVGPVCLGVMLIGPGWSVLRACMLIVVFGLAWMSQVPLCFIVHSCQLYGCMYVTHGDHLALLLHLATCMHAFSLLWSLVVLLIIGPLCVLDAYV